MARALPSVHLWRPSRLSGLQLRWCRGVTRDLPTHFHPGYQVGLVQSGTLEVTSGERRERAEPGALVLLSPGQPHALSSPGGVPVSALVLELEDACVRQALPGEPAELPRFARLAVSDDVHSAALLDSLARELSLDPETGPAARALLLELVQQLFALYAEPAFSAEADPPLGCVSEVQALLAAAPAARWSLSELAERVGVSRFQLVRAFSRELGVPPHEYQIQLRVNRAKELLAGGRLAADVASELGFTDQSHLTRHFKRLTLMTPGDYARKVRRSEPPPSLRQRDTSFPD